VTERNNLIDIIEQLGKLANRLQASLAFEHLQDADMYVLAVAELQSVRARLERALERMERD